MLTGIAKSWSEQQVCKSDVIIITAKNLEPYTYNSASESNTYGRLAGSQTKY